MNSAEKIEFMLNKIREKARISPQTFYIDCTTVADVAAAIREIEATGGFSEGAVTLISHDDQVNILEKFKQDGLLSTLEWSNGKRGAMISLGNQDTNLYEKGHEPGQSHNATFFITLAPNGEVALNNLYRLSKPQFNNENYNFIKFVCSKPPQTLTITDKDVEVGKNFRQVIRDLGFKGELQKLFFPKISKDATEFRNYMTKEQVESYGIDLKKLNSQIKKLKKLKEKE